jgi:hypothetical protein
MAREQWTILDAWRLLGLEGDPKLGANRRSSRVSVAKSWWLRVSPRDREEIFSCLGQAMEPSLQ